jgi:hypothetical protein
VASDDDKPAKPRRGDYLSQGGFEAAMSNWRTAMGRWRERQRSTTPRRGRGGIVTRGIAAAGIVGAVGASAHDPGQASTSTQNYWAQSRERDADDRRSRSLDEGTRDSGNADGWSSEEEG